MLPGLKKQQTKEKTGVASTIKKRYSASPPMTNTHQSKEHPSFCVMKHTTLAPPNGYQKTNSTNMNNALSPLFILEHQWMLPNTRAPTVKILSTPKAKECKIWWNNMNTHWLLPLTHSLLYTSFLSLPLQITKVLWCSVLDEVGRKLTHHWKETWFKPDYFQHNDFLRPYWIIQWSPYNRHSECGILQHSLCTLWDVQLGPVQSPLKSMQVFILTSVYFGLSL